VWAKIVPKPPKKMYAWIKNMTHIHLIHHLWVKLAEGGQFLADGGCTQHPRNLIY
jgi:hypothetical protein